MTEFGLPDRVISGGQTGVDRAALDIALALGIDCGGWCPRGRRAEDGPIPMHYPLLETTTTDYAERTQRNVRESDATLILAHGPLTDGTALTKELADALDRDCLIVDLGWPFDPQMVRQWIADQRVVTLNIAGPRESERPGIYEQARSALGALFARSDGLLTSP